MDSNYPIPTQFIHPDPIPFIKIKGTHREIGRQIGEAFREKIQHDIQNTKELIQATFITLELDWASARMQGRKYLSHNMLRKCMEYQKGLMSILMMLVLLTHLKR
jgi:hypothetical protein